MGKKQSPADTLRKAEEKGAGQDTGTVTGKMIFKKLEPGTKRNYKRNLDLWHEFVRQNPGSSPYDLYSLQKFTRIMAYGIDGAEGIEEPCVETVRKYWNAFTGAWRRANPECPEIPRNVTRSVTDYIKGPLAEELCMTKSKRRRRFATKNHLLHFARQLWMADWHEYKSPSTRLDDWLLHLANTFSSSRIGEYIESSCRPKSGRGLYYRDLTFGVFMNEYGNPEFAVQLTRDAKNMTDTPDKRPQHPLYEGEVPMILCLNPMLPFLARLVVHGAFRDYDTIEKLLGIIPPDEEMLQLHWKEDLLNTPFFKAQSTKDSEERIETAAAFSNRFRAWGLRAGYPKPPTGHDFRAEGLYWIDKFYSEATRMVHAGHMDSNTHRRHYMPTNGADGQGTYLGGTGRTIVMDLFRGLTVPRNPNLSQCLPAEKQFELENTPEYIALNEEIITLERKTDGESVKRRKKLYDERRKMTNKELRHWQSRQPNMPDDPPGYHRAIFSRVRFMMPEREILSQNLFTIDTLRSPTGLNALRTMIALYRQQSEVECRPGLEADKCCCSKPVWDTSYDWKHIYACYKRNSETITGFADLCFLCSEWVFGQEAWGHHCEGHLSQMQEFPMFCDPLMHGGVLATPGYCPFCLTDEKLPATARLKQFTNRGKWLDHVQKHISCLDTDKPQKCPHPQPYCSPLFDSVRHLRFHLQDSHGIPFVKEILGPKRKRDDSEEKMPMQRKSIRPKLETNDARVAVEYAFVNSTLEKMQDHGCISTKSSFHYSPPDQNENDSFEEDRGSRCHETPPSSECSEELIDPAILTIAREPDFHAVNFVNVTNASDMFSANFPAARATYDDLARPGDTNCAVATEALLHRSSVIVQGDVQDVVPKEDRHLSVLDGETNHERPPAVDFDDGQFEVEALIDKRRIGRGVQYLVKWRGYPASENTWEKKKDIHPSMVRAFEASL